MNQGFGRREFLQAAGVAGAAAASVAGLAAAAMATQPASAPIAEPKAAASQSKRTLKKAVMIGMVTEGATLTDKFRIIRDAGFDGVEMNSPSNTPAAEMLAAAVEAGIKIHGMVDSEHWRLSLTCPSEDLREAGLEALKTALRDAKTCGCTSVLLVPGIVDANVPYDAAYERAQQQIRKAIPVAQQTGVKIAVENVWNNFLLSPLEAARFIDEFKSPVMAWHFDIGNVINIGWPEQWIRILGKRIVKLHFKDFSRAKRDKEGPSKGFDVELGQGNAGWTEVMKALDEVGYSTAPEGNWATAEVRGGDLKRLKQIAEQMDRIFGF